MGSFHRVYSKVCVRTIRYREIPTMASITIGWCQVNWGYRREEKAANSIGMRNTRVN